MGKINESLFSHKEVNWETPQDLFDQLDNEFHFTLDPCCTHENAKCKKHYTKEDDGLAQDWTGETVYCNPPYGRGVENWVKKCSEHASGGGYCCHAYPSKNGYKSLS